MFASRAVTTSASAGGGWVSTIRPGAAASTTIRGRTIGTIISGHSAGFEDAHPGYPMMVTAVFDYLVRHPEMRLRVVKLRVKLSDAPREAVQFCALGTAIGPLRPLGSRKVRRGWNSAFGRILVNSVRQIFGEP
jgi:hypothetical protein